MSLGIVYGEPTVIVFRLLGFRGLAQKSRALYCNCCPNTSFCVLPYDQTQYTVTPGSWVQGHLPLHRSRKLPGSNQVMSCYI